MEPETLLRCGSERAAERRQRCGKPAAFLVTKPAGLIADQLFNPLGIVRPKRGFNLAIRRWARQHPNVLPEALDRLASHEIIRRPKIFHPTNEQTWALLMLDRWLLRHDGGYG